MLVKTFHLQQVININNMEPYKGMSDAYNREINELDQDVDNPVIDNSPTMGDGRVEYAVKDQATGKIVL